MLDLSEDQKRDFEAHAFRTLVEHLRQRSDVQNIDLMNLAGFCRNCLSNWYRDAANAAGVELSKDESREIVYGMPYAEWQARHQVEATDAKQGGVREEPAGGTDYSSAGSLNQLVSASVRLPAPRIRSTFGWANSLLLHLQ